MSEVPIINTPETEPHVGALAFECKFMVESSRDGETYKSVTFEGYASAELLGTLANVIEEVVSA